MSGQDLLCCFGFRCTAFASSSALGGLVLRALGRVEALVLHGFPTTAKFYPAVCGSRFVPDLGRKSDESWRAATPESLCDGISADTGMNFVVFLPCVRVRWLQHRNHTKQLLVETNCAFAVVLSRFGPAMNHHRNHTYTSSSSSRSTGGRSCGRHLFQIVPRMKSVPAEALRSSRHCCGRQHRLCSQLGSGEANCVI